MGIRKKIRGKRFLSGCMLLVCLLTLMFPQTAYAAPNDVTLAVEQVFTQSGSSTAADTFTYTLTALQSGNPMPARSSGDTYDFTITGTDTGTVGPITYSTTGTYIYEIQQTVASPQSGYSYDMQVYTVTVYVTHPSSGLRADVVIENEDGLKVSAIAFTNKYKHPQVMPLASDPSIMVDPPVRKTVSGSPSADGTFTFKLEAEDKANPMPTGSKDGVKLMTIKGPGEEDFGTWSYKQEGTYKYTVSEVNNKEKGYTYDAAIYTITDEVTDVNGQLVVDRTVTNTDNKMVDSYDFVNKYTSARGAGTPTGGGGIVKLVRSVKTGDGTMAGLYQAMCFIGGLALIVCVVYLVLNRRKRGVNAKM